MPDTQNTGTSAWDAVNSVPSHNASAGEILHFAIRCAVLAPSSHNSQPWLFKRMDDRVWLIADRRRALSVADPYDRELVISCGAALFNMRVALAVAGKSALITVQPDPLDSDLLAEIVLASGKPDAELAALFPAITKRMTNRNAFFETNVADAVFLRVRQAVEAEWATLSIATSEQERKAVANLVAMGDRIQFEDIRFRRELASWLHPARSDDGLSAFQGELKKTLDFATPVAALVVRTFDVGNGVAARDEKLAAGSPALACISTTTDDVPGWLAAGQALQRMLLVAAQQELSVSYLNQPIEVLTLRDAVRNAMHTARFPQLLMRLGKGLPQSHSPRRGLEEVML